MQIRRKKGARIQVACFHVGGVDIEGVLSKIQGVLSKRVPSIAHGIQVSCFQVRGENGDRVEEEEAAAGEE
jgi:hypothetical protein